MATNPKKSPRGGVKLNVELEIEKPKRKGNNMHPVTTGLKPWKPGQSGNPSGRAKGSGSKLITKAYEMMLQQKIPAATAAELGLDPDSTFADAISLKLLVKALGAEREGEKTADLSAIVELREATEGKLVEKRSLEVTELTPNTLDAILADEDEGPSGGNP